MAKRGFLKPNLDDDFFKEDKVDVDAQKNTTFVYNPVQSWSLNAQQSRLPIAKNRDHILYLLEKNQVLVLIGGKMFRILNFTHLNKIASLFFRYWVWKIDSDSSISCSSRLDRFKFHDWNYGAKTCSRDYISCQSC